MVEVVTFTSTFTNTGKHGVTAVSLSDVVDELHHVNGFTHTGTAEQTDLTAFSERANKVNNLNAGFKQVNGRAQFVELRSGTVNRHTFFFTDFAGFVNRTSQNVHDSAEGLRTNRNHNAVSESLNGHTALETFRRTHSNGSYYAVSKLLLHFKGQAFFSQLVVFVLFKNECVVNFGHFVARELDVHHRADDLYDLSDTHRYSSIRYLFN